MKPTWSFPGARLAAAAIVALLVLPASAQTGWRAERWVSTFARAPAGPPADAYTQVLSNQTLRLIAHTSIGGTRVRVRVSNEMGATPLRIGAAHIALRQGAAQVVAGSDRTLTFGGSPSITIPAGAPVLSDPVSLSVAALADLVVSLYLPDSTRTTTVHPTPLQTSYVSVSGNYTGAATFPVQRTTSVWALLTEVQVIGTGSAIVALGDSITDGSRGTTDTNNRWTDWLARRLQGTPDASGINAGLGVANRGISGNRLLAGADPGSLAGRSGLDRFDRDVLATGGVRYLVVLLGINDLGWGSTSAPVSSTTLILGYRQLIARAHARGIAVIGGTLLPFQGASYYSLQRDAERQKVNNWMRTGNEFDGVIDFDRALRDPANVLRLLPAYDSGDHLHPSNFGYQAMGNAVPLELFRTNPAALTVEPQQEAAALTAEPQQQAPALTVEPQLEAVGP